MEIAQLQAAAGLGQPAIVEKPINDLVSGHIPIVFYSINELVELHKAGRIRVLATFVWESSVFLPDVPTFREAGHDIEATGTSAEAFARIQRADAARWAPAVRDSGFTGEQ
jgi:tripartite-type tricarboxylate transporter receptor subunit TctC